MDRSRAGFTLIELLAALALTAILLASLSMVMGQVVKNNELLMEHLGVSKDISTLRRVMHRDLQGLLVHGQNFELTSKSMGFMTTHNLLMPAPFPVKVTWGMDSDGLYRREENAGIQYLSQTLFSEDIDRWDIDIFDMNRDNWVTLQNLLMSESKPLPVAFRIRFSNEEGMETTIVERIPYVWAQQ